MNAIVRPVLTGEDVFVPNENEVLHTRGVIEYDAASVPQNDQEQERADLEDVHAVLGGLRAALDARNAQAAAAVQATKKRNSETEPHGMYWERDAGGFMRLKPHAWFIADVATTAEKVLITAVQQCKDAETQELIRDMSQALREYVECRRAINTMAGDRKLKGEADDACYQLAQAAKYFIDATEAAKTCIDKGYNIDDNKRIEQLKERSTVAMREGYMITQAVIMAAPTPPVFDLKLASKRVVEYSCRKLTEWFAARREHEATRDNNRAQGAALDLERFLKR